MGTIAQEELLSSLQQLYTSHEHSDLIVLTRKKTHQVHKALLCPRSEYFAAECRKAATVESGSSITLDLRRDDPQAVEMVIQYLYYLDYLVPPPENNTVNGYHRGSINGQEEGHGLVNGNGVHAREDSVPDIASEGRNAEASDLNEFLPMPTKPKNKRKKRKKSTTSGKMEAEDAATDMAEILVEGSLPEKWDDMVAAEEEAMTALKLEDDSVDSHRLVVHAKVYELSKKYSIKSLTMLAQDKFEDEAGDQWETEDFLLAAKEVYSAAAEKNDRGMKDKITEIMCQHPELLKNPETRKAVKGLDDLVMDVLMRVHEQGGFY